MYVVAAAIFFGIMPIWVKLAYTTGLTAIGFTFYRSVLAALMIGAFILYKKRSFRLKKTQWLPVTMACVFFTATILILFSSYQYVSAGIATSLHYLFPVLVMLFSYIIYREKLHIYKWIAVTISVIGIYFIANPEGSTFSLLGVSLALLSAVFFALYALSINHPQMKAIDSLVLAFYLCLFALCTTFVLLMVQGDGIPPITLKGLEYTALVSFFCTALALIFFIKGAQCIGSANASMLSTMEPVVSLLAGVAILNEGLTWATSLGCFLIVLALILIGFADIKESSFKKTNRNITSEVG